MIIPELKLETNLVEQIDKVYEELEELAKAISEMEGQERILEEYFDTVQALIGVANLLAEITELEKACSKHRRKMTKRGHEIKKLWMVNEL